MFEYLVIKGGNDDLKSVKNCLLLSGIKQGESYLLSIHMKIREFSTAQMRRDMILSEVSNLKGVIMHNSGVQRVGYIGACGH